jgi:hypothetical protein
MRSVTLTQLQLLPELDRALATGPKRPNTITADMLHETIRRDKIAKALQAR